MATVVNTTGLIAKNKEKEIIEGTLSTYWNPFVATIPSNAFANQSNLVSINLPNASVFTGTDAFKNCENLKILDLKNIVYSFSATISSYTSDSKTYFTYSRFTVFDFLFSQCFLSSSSYTITTTTASFYISDYVIPPIEELILNIDPVPWQTMNNIIETYTQDLSLEKEDFIKGVYHDLFVGDYTYYSGTSAPNNTKYYPLVHRYNCYSPLTSTDARAFDPLYRNIHAQPGQQGYEDPASKTFTQNNLKKLTLVGGPSILTYETQGLTKLEEFNCSTLVTMAGPCFYSCSNLKTINLPQLTTITGDSCFYNCSKLENNFDKLKTIQGDFVFYSCSSLKSTDFPVLESIQGRGIFTSITNITLSKCTFLQGTTYLYYSYDSPNVPRTGYAAPFQSLTEIHLPILTDLGIAALHNNYSLSIVEIPEVTIIGNRALMGCSQLSELNISKVTTISNYGFNGCRILFSVAQNNILDNLTVLSEAAFGGCSELLNLSIKNIETIGTGAFINCTKLQTITLGSKITTLPTNCFASCQALVNINIEGSNNITTLGSSCFRNCSALTDISIEGFNNVTTIGSSCFASCTALTTVNFPEITTIGNYAFQDCINLTTLILGTSDCVLQGSYVFRSCTALQNIYVPTAYVENYKTATYWSRFASLIKAIEQ